MKTTYAIASGVADVRHNPDAASELVTQALLNTTAISDEDMGEWMHVALTDYEGWIHNRDLAEPVVKGFCQVGEHCATPLDLMVVVAVTHTPLYGSPEGEEILDIAYLSTALPLLNTTSPQRLQVALPGERTAWIARNAAKIQRQEALYPRTDVNAIIAYAHTFLDVPYLWGGTSWQGIDCSGLVQLCYRMGGYCIPRDADQQHDALAHVIQYEKLRAGDLIFFGSKSITHVALALNYKEYIHAEGQRDNRVVINSFDPTDLHYSQRLSEIVWGIKRVIV